MSTLQGFLPQRSSKPPPAGPAPPPPPPPGSTPPNPPGAATSTANMSSPQSAVSNGTKATATPNGTATSAKNKKGVQKAETAIDPQAMYESLKSKIAALEEELSHADEEELKFAEEAQKSVRGMEENAVHTKYIELFAEMKRVERDHAKEKQKLTKDKDTAKSQLTKANQNKAKLENLARDLTKENKKLREEKQQLAQEVGKLLDEMKELTSEISKGREKARQQEMKNRELPEIVVKVVCKYRAELFFRIGRKMKLSRLFSAWSERMEGGSSSSSGRKNSSQANGVSTTLGGAPARKGSDTASIKSNNSSQSGGTANGVGSGVVTPNPPPRMSFVYTHQGRTLNPEVTIEEAGIENQDEILAVELMDLTGPVPDDADELVEARRPRLKKNWTDDPQEAKKAMEEIFDGVTKERLKLVLRQYELRERHFECFVRSKELELLLARYREDEQRHRVEVERSRIDKLEADNQRVRKELEEVHNGQTMLIGKLIECCKEPNAERTQRLFTSLREELEKRGTKLVDGVAGG